MPRWSCLLALLAPMLAPANSDAITGNEAVVGLPCEGCEAVFQGLPAVLSTAARLAPVAEPGQALALSGTVRNQAGKAIADVVVYAYQTDHSGHYAAAPELSGAAARHGRLRGWVRTDADGRYQFQTIRPGAYPGRNVPQHIHLHILEPGRCTYYIGDVLFADDPLLTTTLQAHEQEAYGGSGVAQPTGNARDGWTVTRDITLGLNVPNYGACANRP